MKTLEIKIDLEALPDEIAISATLDGISQDIRRLGLDEDRLRQGVYLYRFGEQIGIQQITNTNPHKVK